jgi:hypothetical protein
MKFYPGTAPYVMAKVEFYENGCMRYEAGRTKRCLCGMSLEPAGADDAVAAMRIAPQTLFDAGEVSIRRGDLVAQRAYSDVPPRPRKWLEQLDAALGPQIGKDYEPFSTLWKPGAGAPGSE